MEFNELKKQIDLDVDILKIVEFKYVQLLSQRIMIDNIKSLCIQKQENGLYKIDYILKELFELLNVLINYTNLEFDGLYNKNNEINITVALSIYDYFKENHLKEIVYKKCDVAEFLSMLKSELKQEVENDNSISAVLHKVVEILPSEEKVKNLLDELPSVLNSITSIKKPRKTSISKKLKE